MKKVRMLVSAALVLAVVSGALAFKTVNYGSGDIYRDLDGNGQCDNKDVTKKFDEASAQTILGETSPTTAPCSTQVPFDAVND